jgi:TNF receptor-associated protein 1
VRVSKRLVGSPATVVDGDQNVTSSMRKLLKSMDRERGAASSAFKSDLEINPKHTIIARLEATRQADAALATKVAEQVLDNALVAAGLMEDPRAMLKRLNELLEQVLVKK